jgi:hypothetical protein
VFADIDHLLFAAVSQVVAALDGGDIDDLACLAELRGRQRSGGIVCDQPATVLVNSWGSWPCMEWAMPGNDMISNGWPAWVTSSRARSTCWSETAP